MEWGMGRHAHLFLFQQPLIEMPCVRILCHREKRVDILIANKENADSYYSSRNVTLRLVRPLAPKPNKGYKGGGKPLVPKLRISAITTIEGGGGGY